MTASTNCNIYLVFLALACIICMHNAKAIPSGAMDDLFIRGEPSGSFSIPGHSARGLLGDHSAHDHDHSSGADHDHSTSTEHIYDHIDDHADDHAHDHPHTTSNAHHERPVSDFSSQEDSYSIIDSQDSTEVEQPLEHTIVTSARELQDAVKRGDVHIEMQAHLDLTGQEMQECGGTVKCILGKVPATVKTIRGNCKDGPPADMMPPEGTADLREFLPNQCMLIADVDLLKVSDSKLWVDQVYVRFRNAGRQPAVWSPLQAGTFYHFFEAKGPDAALWITSSMLQGDGDGETECFFCGLAAWDNADVFVGGTTFADFEGDHAAGVTDGATASFMTTTFTQNRLSSLNPLDANSGPHLSLLIADVGFGTERSTTVRLQQCTFDRNTPVDTATLVGATPDATQSALFYSDSSSPKVCEVDSTAWSLEIDQKADAPPVVCNYRSSKTLAEAKDDTPANFFLSADNEWLVKAMTDIDELKPENTFKFGVAGTFAMFVGGVTLGFLAALAGQTWVLRARQAHPSPPDSHPEILAEAAEASATTGKFITEAHASVQVATSSENGFTASCDKNNLQAASAPVFVL